MKRRKSTPVEALRQVLSTGPEYLADYRSGHFVFAQFYDRSGTIVAEASAPELPMIESLKAFVNSQPLSFPNTERAVVQTRRVSDNILVYFVLPVADSQAIAKRDADTDAHNYRVSLYAARLAEKIGLGAENMRALIKGSFIHDAGKIGIPDAVLHKPGPLNEEEYRVMQTHVGMGVDIVRRAAWLRDAVPVVAAHHEKFGGGGYPQGARADDIPLVARIFAISDVFDALTSKRSYKDPLRFEETLQILSQGRGVHFDPELLDAFSDIAAEVYQKYAGAKEEDLRQELVAIVSQYFSAGMESLHYGMADVLGSRH